MSSPITTSTKTALLPHLSSSSALRFGTFTLKSGRSSPYFFNSSHLYSAAAHSAVCAAYAAVLTSPPFTTEGQKGAGVPKYHILFGPAYKGIPLAASILSFLLPSSPSTSTSPSPFENISYAYSRKEPKAHGEGGSLVGAPLQGKKVVIIDDVITAGTAIREAVGIIQAAGGIVVGVVVLLDREERVRDDGEEGDRRSAVQVVREELGGVDVRAVLGVGDLLGACERGEMGGEGQNVVQRLKEYRERYGCK